MQRIKKDVQAEKKAQQKGTLRASAIVVILLFASLFLLWLHWKWAIVSNDKTNFQRAGSIIIVLEIIVLTKVNAWQFELFPTGSFSPDPPKWWKPLFTYISVVTAIAGTIVWGYGDLFVEPFLVEKNCE